MMEYPKILILLFIFFVSDNLLAQDYYKLFYGDKIYSKKIFPLVSQVHSLDDFIARYNGYNNAFGKPIDKNSLLFKKINKNKKYWESYRSKVISTLIDTNLFKTTNPDIRDFIINAGKGSELDFDKDDWEVIIPIKGKWRKSNLNAKLIMKITHEKKKRYRWIIDDVEFEKTLTISDLNKLEPEISDSIYITPSSHDIGFIRLKDILSGKNEMKYHILRNNINLAILNYLIQNEGYRPVFNKYFFHFNIDKNINFVLDDRYQIIKIKKYK